MRNNHDLLCIEFVCSYLDNTQNSNYYITVVIWLHFVMQNNHDLLCIAFVRLYLDNSQNSIHYINVGIFGFIFDAKYPRFGYASNFFAYTTWLTVKIQPIISPWLFGFTFWCKITTICYASHSCVYTWLLSQNLTHYVIMVILSHFLCEITTICYTSNSCAYIWLTVKIQLIISPWLFKRLCT